METRHQVFVSSTYEDLEKERQEVIHALLELDCMPAGMELFPASDEDSWSLIKGVIDDSDYYVVIVAGRYGHLNNDGVGFTEREYDYAVSVGKPTIAFLHEHPERIPAGLTETTDKGKQRLKKFCEKLRKSKQCKFWSTPTDLGGKVSRSLVQLRKHHPSPGWVPGRYAADEKMLLEIETLRKKLIELEAKSDDPPPGIETLAQGGDELTLTIHMPARKEKPKRDVDISVTWDGIFKYVGPSLMGECHEAQLEERIRLAFYHALATKEKDWNIDFDVVILPYVYFDQIKVQLEALGLITHGIRKRAVSDTGTYWMLTTYGRRYLTQLRALRRQQEAHVLEKDEKRPVELVD